MKTYLIKAMIFSVFASLIFTFCGKKEVLRPNPFINYPPPPPPPPPPAPPCDNSHRPVINATLVPIGSLSIGRMGIASATAGNKIVFAGGWNPYYFPIVDIYDFVTNTWSTATLSDDPGITSDSRAGFAIASTGDKIFFAGGGNPLDDYCTSRVDIYDAIANTWTTAELSVGRMGLAAASIGNKVFFAGGIHFNGESWSVSNVVDIYDNATNTWTTATLSEGRMELSATTAGNRIYFAGGHIGAYFSTTIDIYNATTNTWSTSSLQEPKFAMASIATDNKIFWGGGFNGSNNISNLVEIRDLNSGVSSFTCLYPKRAGLKAVKKNNNIIFFTGAINNDPFSGTHFEIYNTVTNQWSTGVLNKRINDATIISANNTIYVAGGSDQINGPYLNGVWKLEF